MISLYDLMFCIIMVRGYNQLFRVKAVAIGFKAYGIDLGFMLGLGFRF